MPFNRVEENVPIYRDQVYAIPVIPVDGDDDDANNHDDYDDDDGEGQSGGIEEEEAQGEEQEQEQQVAQPPAQQNIAIEDDLLVRDDNDPDEQWIDELNPDHFITHLPKCRQCEICNRAKCFAIPHRRLENQSAERQAEHELQEPAEFLDKVLVDHAIFGKRSHGRNGQNASFKVFDVQRCYSELSFKF